MLNRQKHKLLMGKILKDFYSDSLLARTLGFKGGTCAYLFYNLTRFSTDLDFDFLGKADKKEIFEKIKSILVDYGTLRVSRIKRNTLFFLLSYSEEGRNIKVEVSTRSFDFKLEDYYQFKKYLGIPMKVANKEYLFSSKLVALTSRNELAMRDVYDIHFFFDENWNIDDKIIQTRTGKDLKEHLQECLSTIENIKQNQLLSGLGEVLDEKEKDWVKRNLKEETSFLIKNYISSIS